MIESFKLPNITPETLTGSIVSFNDEYGNLPLKSCASLITGYQEGSGNPSPQNERPLHAWSSANLTACGTNLWDEEWEVGTYDASGQKTADNRMIRSKNFIAIEPSTTYYVQSANVAFVYFFYDIDKNFISTNYLTNSTFTSPANAYYMTFRTSADYGNVYHNDISINYPSTDTSYHAYNGNTYTFTFGQSIYQGSIDWKRGVVVGDMSIEIIDGINRTFDGVWGNTNSGDYGVYASINGIRNNKAASNIFKRVQDSWRNLTNGDFMSSSGGSNTWSFVLPSTITSLTEANQWAQTNPITVAYELATPIEIPLGGVNLLTQEGQNNIFADCGDTTLEWLKVN